MSLNELRDPSGNLGRLLANGTPYFRPVRVTIVRPLLPDELTKEINLREETPQSAPTPCLAWEDAPLRLVKDKDTAGALDGFIRLHRESDEAILAYAKRWGVLGLCKCRQPFTHSRQIFQRPDVQTNGVDPRGPNLATCRPSKLERLSDWRKLSADAVMILRYAQLAVEGRQDWEPENDPLERRWRHEIKLAELDVEDVPRSGRERAFRERIRGWAQGGSNQWLMDSGVSLFCEAYETESKRQSTALTLGVSYSTLFDLLSVQLLLAVARADTIASCAECTMPFARRYRPQGQRERRIYCPSCGKSKAPVKQAVRRHREIQRDARKLYLGGASIPAIAEKLGRDPKMIERWMKNLKGASHEKTRSG